MSHLVLVRTPWLDPSGHMNNLRLLLAPEALGYRQAFGITCASQNGAGSVARQARCCLSGLYMPIYIHDCTCDYIYDWIYDYM